MNSAANRFGQGAGTSPAHRRGAPDGDRLEPRQGHRHARRRGGTSAGTPGDGRPRLCPCSDVAHGLHHSAGSPSTRLFRNCGLVTIALDQAAEAVAVGREPRRAWPRWSRRPRAAGCGRGRRPAACGRGCRRTRPGDARRGTRAGRRRPSPSPPPGKVARVSTGRPPRSLVAALADRAVALEDQADRVEPLVAAGAALVGAVPGEGLAAGSGRRAWPRRSGSSGTSAGGGGMCSPSSRRTTQ